MKRKTIISGIAPIIIILMVIGSLFVSCGTLTVKQRQLSNINTFNMAYKSYLDLYDKQTPEIKAEWKANIDPYWKEASKAIDAYLAFSDPNSTEAQKKLVIYETALKTAKDLLLKYGVTIKEK